LAQSSRHHRPARTVPLPPRPRASPSAWPRTRCTTRSPRLLERKFDIRVIQALVSSSRSSCAAISASPGCPIPSSTRRCRGCRTAMASVV